MCTLYEPTDNLWTIKMDKEKVTMLRFVWLVKKVNAGCKKLTCFWKGYMSLILAHNFLIVFFPMILDLDLISSYILYLWTVYHLSYVPCQASVTIWTLQKWSGWKRWQSKSPAACQEEETQSGESVWYFRQGTSPSEQWGSNKVRKQGTWSLKLFKICTENKLKQDK